MGIDGNQFKTANIVQLLQSRDPDILDIADQVYHADKSLGRTLIAIRTEIRLLDDSLQRLAIYHLSKVMDVLNSPTLFINKIE